MIHRIFLIGYRATGKTTIGTRLADRLGFTFIDTDRQVCRTHHMTIEEIVRRDGWDTFRGYEADALKAAAECGNDAVISTGGGAVLHEQLWADIRKRGFVVWLSADIKVIADRIQGDGGAVRPSLTGRDIVAEISAVLGQREELYRKFSHTQVDTGTEDVEQVVTKIRSGYSDFLKTGNKL